MDGFENSGKGANTGTSPQAEAGRKAQVPGPRVGLLEPNSSVEKQNP